MSNSEDAIKSMPNGMDAIKENQSEDHLSRVKKLSQKLHLSTKRRSVLQWKKIIEERKQNGLLGKANLADFSILSNDDLENKDPGDLEDEHDYLEVEANGLPLDENANFCNEDKLQILPQICSSQRTNIEKSPQAKSASPSKEIETSQRTNIEKSPQAKSASPSKEIETSVNDTKKQTTANEAERRRKIDDALRNIRKDLMLMRMEDHALARKLLNIREKMNRQKAALLCEEHAEMLDHFTWEIEEEKELDEKHKMSDLSSALLRRPDSLLRSPSILRQMGIDKTTYELRRFTVV